MNNEIEINEVFSWMLNDITIFIYYGAKSMPLARSSFILRYAIKLRDDDK